MATKSASSSLMKKATSSKKPQQRRTIASLRGLAAETETVNRKDSFTVDPLIIGIEEGFNIRIASDPELRAHIDSIKESIRQHIGRHDPENKICHDGLLDVFPPVVIRVTDEGIILAVDGHSRTTAVRELITQEHYDIKSLDVVQTKEDARGRIGLMLRSGMGKAYTPLERAIALTRLADGLDGQEGMSFPQISRFLGGSITPQRVEQLVILGRASDKVREAVAEKRIVADTVIEILRKHRDEPAVGEQKIFEMIDGNSKARPVGKAQSQPSVPRKAAAGIFQAIVKDSKTLTKQVESVAKKGEGWENEPMTVTLPAGVIAQLLEKSKAPAAKSADDE